MGKIGELSAVGDKISMHKKFSSLLSGAISAIVVALDE